MEKICGNCKYIIPKRMNRYGFNGECKEIVIRENETDIAELVHVTRTDVACKYFEEKEREK